MADERRGGKWQIDRRVQVIPIILVLVQLVGFIVYAAKLDSRVEDLEEKAAANKPMTDKVAQIDKTVATLEVKIVGIEKQGDRIEQKLDKAIQKGN